MSIFTLGIDIGSTASKCVIIRDGEEIVAKALVAVGAGTSGPQRAIAQVLENAGMTKDNLQFIKDNLIEGGTIYLLGGEACIPSETEELFVGYEVKRLAGPTRFETNLAILEEVGVQNEEILISTGWGFADCLSASATGLPILLLNSEKSTLTQAQFNFLEEHKNNT